MYTPTSKDNILDLIFTNEAQVKDDVRQQRSCFNWGIEWTANKVYNNRTKLCSNKQIMLVIAILLMTSYRITESMSASALWDNLNPVMQAIKCLPVNT